MVFGFRTKHVLKGLAALLVLVLFVVPLARFVIFPLGSCGRPLEENSIPDTVVAAVISQEDGRFFEHWGIDWFQFREAAKSNLKRRKVGRGASTIDMQVAGLCYLDSAGRSSFYEKWQELVLATLMNIFYEKSEILRAYLSKAPMNPDKSVEGFAAASRHYYGRELRALSNSQELKLVTTLRSRVRFNPKVFDQNMRGKHLRVLRRVEREQYAIRMALRKRIAGFDYVWVRKSPPPPPPVDPMNEATDEEMNEWLVQESDGWPANKGDAAAEALTSPSPDAPADPDVDPALDPTFDPTLEPSVDPPLEHGDESAPEAPPEAAAEPYAEELPAEPVDNFEGDFQREP